MKESKNLYFYTRHVLSNGHTECLPFNASHHIAFGDHDHLPLFRARELMQTIIARWNAFRPDLYQYAIAEVGYPKIGVR